ncbi:putative metal-binding motif-containing protein [Hyalangium rubrum]|uniref:Metal-binding motif-containing protein n=1 Tax=Hyalangium rubrum TaxID=3103134 RepID=A0ABU5GV07_9BACT|nr:putative metal-binding motif-containing protein [Hyalangium sp. s54d21]MDY7225004.1 putative metal-binding motif-containing protein [Hyalangium sp. s54d21]
MKRGLLLSLVALFVGCGDSLPDERQAAVHVDVSFDFNAGCIVVLARDKSAPEKQQSKQALVFSRPVRSADFAVFRGSDWGRTLEVFVTAHERECGGQEVARETREFTLDKPGTQEVLVALSAPDVDNDGYVAAPRGTDCNDAQVGNFQQDFFRDQDGDGVGAGTSAAKGCTAPAGLVASSNDCNDADNTIAPGKTELCDGKDNNCVNGMDEGLTLTGYYLDGDGDGAGAGPAVMACAQPAGHVISGNDCDDTNAQRTPGKAEVCDGVDNNCVSGVDEGLPLTDYFRDNDGDGVGGGAAVKACMQPAGLVTTGNDCDDTNAQVTPGKAEVCDEVDNNCVGGVDEGLPTTAYYRDADGDSFGAQASMVQRCRMPTGYVTAGSGFDCDDTNANVKPGATEVCNNIDDNCVGGSDEGFNKNWYRDADNDTYGLQSDVVVNCVQPGGRVAPTAQFDCDDTRNTVFPGATETCNSRDDDCDNSTDETFADKGNACTNDTCTGTRQCKADETGTECNAQPPVNYYPDADADTAGATAGPVAKVCASQSPPANHVLNDYDCDDTDPHNRGGGTEVCDDRDNNCFGGKDEENVCGGKIWKPLNDATLTARNWNTVAVGDGGYPVWVAGDAGALAFRATAGAAFTSRFALCGAVNWRAVWVQPGTGQVFMAGDGGNLATLSLPGASCATGSTVNATGGTTSNRPLTGIIGFGSSTTVYVVNDVGQVYEWTYGNHPVFKKTSGESFQDIHGASASKLLAVGNIDPQNDSDILGYDAVANSNLVDHSFSSSSTDRALRGVWAWDNTHAYAVGALGTLWWWDGNTTWHSASQDTSVTTRFNSVVAFDISSAYIACEDGKIRRGRVGGWTEHYSGSTALKDIAAASTQDIWAVGNGVVVHFPEAP